MNAPVPNTKAELLSKTVEHVDITAYDARPVIDAMRKMSFSSRDTARAADIFSMAQPGRSIRTIFATWSFSAPPNPTTALFTDRGEYSKMSSFASSTARRMTPRACAS